MVDKQLIQLESAETLHGKHLPVDPRIAHIRTHLHQRSHSPVGFRTGIVILKTAGVCRHAGIQAQRHMIGHFHRKDAAQPIEDLTRRRCRAVQETCLGIRDVGNVMIDAQVYPAAVVFLDAAAQQLGVCHIHGNDALRFKMRRCAVLFRQHKLISLRDLVIAQHHGTLAQLVQHLCQRISGADAVSVRAAVNQNIRIFAFLEPCGSLCQCQFLHHVHSFSVLSSSGMSSTAGWIWCSIRSISALCAMESSATKCSTGLRRIFRRCSSSRRI